jgi:hypothetical protein
MYTARRRSGARASFQQSQDTLYALAGDTGGKALLDNNDLTRGIVNAQQAISDYYVLGVLHHATELNGKFRHVRISGDAERRQRSSNFARATTRARSSRNSLRSTRSASLKMR